MSLASRMPRGILNEIEILPIWDWRLWYTAGNVERRISRHEVVHDSTRLQNMA